MAGPYEILIVDDNAANMQLLISALEDDYTVRAAINGKIALESAKQSPPDLVLLDLMMPEMNGYEVCEAMKADADLRDVPVIFITGIADQIDRQRAAKLGAVEFLLKPLSLPELFVKIAQYLD